MAHSLFFDEEFEQLSKSPGIYHHLRRPMIQLTDGETWTLLLLRHYMEF